MRMIWIHMIIAIFCLVSCSQVHQETFVADEHVENSESIVERLKGAGIDVYVDLLPEDVSEERKHPITHILLHFTSNAAITPEDPYEVEAIRHTFIDYGVSAHFLIGREGEVYQWVPVDRVAYHAGKGRLEQFPEYEDRLNHYSIGIEMMGIGTKDEMIPMMDSEIYDLIAPSDIGYTDAQYETVEKLIDVIIAYHPEIKRDRNHIIGHDEYAPDRKTDPGSLFEWERIGF